MLARVESKTRHAENRILNRARKAPLTRAFGAASPATKRARRIVSGAERDILIPRAEIGPSPSILSLKGRGEDGSSSYARSFPASARDDGARPLTLKK
jgi:hypothetical protein